MRILYVGQLGAGTTSADRMEALRRLGHEVRGIDTARYQAPGRLLRSIQWRMMPRVLLGELNARIEEEARADGCDVLWVDKGIWVFPETLIRVRRHVRGEMVHYTPDAQIVSNRSPHFLASIGLYDRLVTTKQFEVAPYRELGARHVMLVPQSYCSVRFASACSHRRFASDVGFVSAFKANYGEILSKVTTAGYQVAVWGPNWPRAAKLRRVPASIVRGNGLWGPEYVAALASFKIGLGLLSKSIPEGHTTRSFEIPAAGAFLLAERTDEHRSYFVEGEEAEFFGSLDELLDKLRYYLAHDATRQQIAARGRERCLKSGYDNESVLGGLLKRD